MTLLADKIFDAYFTSYEYRSDPNKDVNGKGTLQRFEEMLGNDWDVELIPLIRDLVANTKDPFSCLDQYVPFLEGDFGLRLYMGSTIGRRRQVVQVINNLHQIKGTKKCYVQLFAMMGWTAVITEHFDYYGFDSATTFDSPLRRFDSGVCPSCTDYTIDLTGPAPSLTGDDLAVINSIIGFNEPINATLRLITYNGNPITVNPDYNDDYSNDYFI